MLASRSALRKLSTTRPPLDHVMPVRQRGGEPEILLHQKDGIALGLQPRDRAADLLHHHGGEPFRRLVEQQEARARAQNAGDGQHLLLAARQLGAAAGEPFLEVGEERKDRVARQAARPHHGRQHQVFLDRERGEDAALFWAIADARARDGPRRQPDRFPPLETHRTPALAEHAHDGAQRRGLAGAITSQKRDDLPFAHLEVHAVQDMRLAVPALKAADAEADPGLAGGCRVEHRGLRHVRPRYRLRRPRDRATRPRRSPRPAPCRAPAR